MANSELDNNATRQRAKAAERMRQFRRRKRYGMQTIRISLSAGDIATLVEKGYLDPNQREDLSAVGRSAKVFISDALNDLL